MHYLKTKLSTDWPEKEPFSEKLIRGFLFFIPEANPDYRNKMHLIDEWLIEFEDSGLPHREIGINKKSEPVLAGPDENNYGFWLDTNMKLEDFKGEQVSKDHFEMMWERYFKTNANSKIAL